VLFKKLVMLFSPPAFPLPFVHEFALSLLTLHRIDFSGTTPTSASTPIQNPVQVAILMLTYLNKPNLRRLLPKSLTAHVESVLADQARVLAAAGDDASITSSV
jgi:hypothetical protein